MALLLALTQPIIEPQVLSQPGLAGIVVPIPLADVQSGTVNASLHGVFQTGLELYCRLTAEHFATRTHQEMWAQLEQLQAQLPFAKVVLPFSSPSLKLVAQSSVYGWDWHLEGATTCTQVAMALTAHTGGIWTQVDVLDSFHELDGDELCSQVRSFIDDRYIQAKKPLVVASEIRDEDHVERTLVYGCDRIVVGETLLAKLMR